MLFAELPFFKRFAAKAEVDPARMRQVLMGGFASSKIVKMHGERMIKRSFDPGSRIELHQQDLNLALSSSRRKNLGSLSYVESPLAIGQF